jgi:hypothetical protein
MQRLRVLEQTAVPRIERNARCSLSFIGASMAKTNPSPPVHCQAVSCFRPAQRRIKPGIFGARKLMPVPSYGRRSGAKARHVAYSRHPQKCAVRQLRKTTQDQPSIGGDRQRTVEWIDDPDHESAALIAAQLTGYEATAVVMRLSKFTRCKSRPALRATHNLALKVDLSGFVCHHPAIPPNVLRLSNFRKLIAARQEGWRQPYRPVIP